MHPEYKLGRLSPSLSNGFKELCCLRFVGDTSAVDEALRFRDMMSRTTHSSLTKIKAEVIDQLF